MSADIPITQCAKCLERIVWGEAAIPIYRATETGILSSVGYAHIHHFDDQRRGQPRTNVTDEMVNAALAAHSPLFPPASEGNDWTERERLDMRAALEAAEAAR